MAAITTQPMPSPDSSSAWRRPALRFLRLRALFAVTTFLESLQALLAALGAFGGALDEFSTEQLELGDLGAIALAPSQTNDAAVTARSLSELGSELVEKLLHRCGSAQERSGLTARVQSVILGERDHAIHQRAGRFCLGDGGDGEIVFDDAGDQSAKQGLARGDVPFQFESGALMTHGYSGTSSISGVSSPSGPPKCGSEGGGATSRPCASNFMPKLRPRLARISLISLSDLRPKFLVRSISASVRCTRSPMV